MQGVPYALVTFVSAIWLKQAQFSNAQIAFFTSVYIIPWTFKFLFAVLLEQVASKKCLTVFTEYSLGIITLLIVIAFGFQWNLMPIFLFLLMGLFASWHDISSDGLYLSNLTQAQQIDYVGIRTLAFQLARLLCQGGIVIFIGFLSLRVFTQTAWALGFAFLAVLILFFATYHFFIIPSSEKKNTVSVRKVSFSMAVQIIHKFFQKKHIAALIIFLLFYNAAEAQLIKIIPLFLLDAHAAGGLNLKVDQVGFIYGGLGLLFMIIGVLLSGLFVRNFGIRKCLIMFTALLLFSQLGYIIISFAPWLSLMWLIVIVLFAQFCFGLSNNVYMVCLLDSVREDKYSMSFYAIGTGVMAMGMFLPGIISGSIQHFLGYFLFFIWIVLLQGVILCFVIFNSKVPRYEYS